MQTKINDSHVPQEARRAEPVLTALNRRSCPRRYPDAEAADGSGGTVLRPWQVTKNVLAHRAPREKEKRRSSAEGSRALRCTSGAYYGRTESRCCLFMHETAQGPFSNNRGTLQPLVNTANNTARAADSTPPSEAQARRKEN